ncbi:MAG: AAA family ATPase, partial [Anaerolineales bacterium]|nr:AAA family ATPase [Anaerolineales bacterium]
FTRNNNPKADTTPFLAVADLDGNGSQEAVLGFFTPSRRFSRLLLLEGDGTARWERPVDGRITALTLIQFSETATPEIAVGTSLGNVNIYSATGQRRWPRTVNRPVTALSVVPLADGPGLAVGTSTGSVIVFDAAGKRHFTTHLDQEADRRVIALSAGTLSPQENQPVLAAVIGPQAEQPGPTDMALLGDDGRILKTITGIDELGLTRLVDTNRDRLSELLLVQFPNLSLLGLGLGASETAQEWSRTLFAVPLSYLVVDFDQDGEDELLIGADDGRLHRFENDGTLYLRIAPGGEIAHLATLPITSAEPPRIVVGRNVQMADDETTGILEVRLDNGERVWSVELPSAITSLLVGNVNNRGEPEIIAGTEDGQVIVFSVNGSRLWESEITGPVQHMFIISGADPRHPNQYELVVANETEIYKLREDSTVINRIAFYEQPIVGLHVLRQPGRELAVRFLVLVADGYAYGLNWNGILLPPWPIPLDGVPILSLLANEQASDIFEIQQARTDSILVASDQDTLVNLVVENSRPRFAWRIRGVGQVTALQWGDVDGDSRPDIVAANRDRNVLLFSRTPEFSGELALSSAAFGLTALRRDTEQKADLMVITGNGLVELFQAQENRPPLLTNPTTDVRPGQYNLSVAVRDVEGDAVTLRLEMQNPDTGRWQALDERQLNTGNGQVPFLIVNPAAYDDGLRYRYFFSDGFHTGYVTPTLGPRPLLMSPLISPSQVALLLLVVLGVGTAVLFIRQAQSPPARAQRFHRHLGQQSEQTLLLLENKYTYTGNSPDFWLYLTSQARQSGDLLVASLADGLFLLADRPHAALSIFNSVLEEIGQRGLAWECLRRWQMTYKTGQALLDAPSMTELALLRPQLVELLTLLEETEQWSPILDMLLPVLTNVRDSERVELVDDRLVYLNEAMSLLATIEEQFSEFSERIEKMLAQAIVRRWRGLIGAKMDELRGRADLVVTLKTKRLVPNGRSHLAIEIHNNGRAAAEQVIALLEERPSYLVHSPPQTIPLIPPGRARQASFEIEPQVNDRFRIALTLTYNDRNQQDKVTAFGDMVHLLPPVRDFKPIPNPYIPGSPLRRESPLFYGRQELFDFISENVGEQAQRNVLILIGQRRTGKTSALLQLEHHLPPALYPVYIDCQSLGVTPGMPSLLNELAWLIADGLASREIDVTVPGREAWQTDPTGLFQRKFLPYVQGLLPEHSTLVLVFDEFEAIENLVQDDILPPTIFPYLRHLMQHSVGLSFIFVGTRRLEEMGADYWSVLFNIALYQKIGYLSPESAVRLITEPVAPSIIYDDLALDKILRVTAGHPYFLQLVCYTLVKRANSQGTGYVTISDVNAALDEMLSLGEVHFAYLWQRSNQTERALLTAVAHLIDSDQPFHPEDIVEGLKHYDIHLDPAAVTAALQSLVEREIMREVTEEAKTLYELHIGLVGLWVAKNKGLTRLLYTTGE